MTLLKPPDAFRLGSTITVGLSRHMAPRFQLPATAVFEADGRSAVWIVNEAGDAVSRRDVTVADRNGERVSITEGLKPGERVVLAGARSLGEGQRVRLADTSQ